MSSSRPARPDPCSHENCGSRRFHIGDDGYTYCDQGHQQSERGAVVAVDTGELLNLGRKSRRRDSDGESIASRSSALTRYQAFEQYLLCLQLVLRKQLRWLIEVQKLPEELEMLVRDLWALRLQRIQNMVPREFDTETEGASSQVFTSTSESESASVSRSSRRSTKLNAAHSRQDTPGLLELLALTYIGITLLRISVTVHDLHGWVNSGSLLYYRAAREVPLGMRERLPGRYHELLEPQDLLQGQWIHERVWRAMSNLDTTYGMAVPPINHPLLLFRWMKELALPIEVFAGTQRLARLLEIEWTFSLQTQERSKVLRSPEVRLMAMLVTTTKLLFPFDNIRRYARSETDLSAMIVDWERWASIHATKPTKEGPDDPLSFEQAFQFNDEDCLAASDERLDQYLTWCADNIATEEIRERGRASRDAPFRRMMFELFPLAEANGAEPSTENRSSQTGADEQQRDMQGVLVSRLVVDSTAEAHAKIHRPGSFYKRYRTVEELSGPSRILFDRAAELAGVSLDGMVKAVRQVERMVWKHEDRLRRDES